MGIDRDSLRDPKRIKKICQLLEIAWSRCPDQRLGQFLLNFVFGSLGRDSHIYHKEDDLIEKILKLYTEKINEFKKLPEQEEIEFFKRTAKEIQNSLKKQS